MYHHAQIIIFLKIIIMRTIEKEKVVSSTLECLIFSWVKFLIIFLNILLIVTFFFKFS